MKRMFLIAGSFACTLLGGAPEAAAADQQQHAVSSCAVTAGASIADIGTSVGFAAGNIGTVTVHCPVDVNLASFDTLEVSYRDSDGTGNTGKVDLHITSVAKTSVATVANVAVFVSSVHSATAWNNKVQALGSAFIFDHANYYYYVRISLGRSSSATQVPIGHVKLCTSGVSC